MAESLIESNKMTRMSYDKIRVSNYYLIRVRYVIECIRILLFFVIVVILSDFVQLRIWTIRYADNRYYLLRSASLANSLGRDSFCSTGVETIGCFLAKKNTVAAVSFLLSKLASECKFLTIYKRIFLL